MRRNGAAGRRGGSIVRPRSPAGFPHQLAVSSQPCTHLTVSELAAGLRARKFSSLDLTLHFLGRIERFGPELNAFVTVTADRALADARAADELLAKGEGGPLTGVPIAHKDIFCTDGILTTCSSKMLSNFVAPYDATVVARWRAAGTVLLGKTNMDEFAMGSSNETSFFGPVKNPWDLTRVPGGSSGGSAAAVASCIAPAASGTDTGGSIRQPAALTNLTGLKPTYGRVSRYGHDRVRLQPRPGRRPDAFRR